MDQDLQTKIKNRFNELPPKIQEAITESDWVTTMRKIVKEANLRIDQGGAVEMETLLTMLGLASPEEYVDNLITEAQIDRDAATNISLKIEEQIFKKIRDILIEEDEEKNDIVEELLKDAKKNSGEFVKPTITTSPKISPTTDIAPNQVREDILKEIEDKEEHEIMIPQKPQAPSTQVNTSEQNKNIIAQKLQTPSVSQPKTISVDPYREMPL